MSESFAQFSVGANASAYASIGGGHTPGVWGGAQACPYPGGGRSGGGMSKLDALIAQRDELDERIDTLETEQEEIVDGDHDLYGDDDIPMSSEIREGLVNIIEADSRVPCRSEPADAWPTYPEVTPAIVTMIGQMGGDPTAFCDNGRFLSVDAICRSGSAYTEPVKNNTAKKCSKMMDRYDSLEKTKNKIVRSRDKIDEQIYDLEQAKLDRELKAMESGKPLPPEGTCMTGDCYGAPEPKAPGWGQILAAGAGDLALNYLYGRYVIRPSVEYITDKQAALGWATDSRTPYMFGSMGTPISGALWASYAGSQGGNIACSPGNGYGYGPGGSYGSPYGSPYGACGGAFYGGCGPGAGGGSLFGPQFGFGGGLGGGFGGGFPGMGGGFGGGFGPGFGGGFPGMGGGFGGGFGPGFGGGFPGGGYGNGVYPGGLGFGGGFGGGFGPGFGGGFPGFGGGFGPGGFGSPYGMNPYGGLGGGQYQMQMLQMQMQQQQAYMAAQARALQNQQIIGSQLQGAVYEAQQAQARIAYLQQQLYAAGGGGGFGLGIGLNFGIGGGFGGGFGGGYVPGFGGGGGYGSGPVPWPGSGGGGTGGTPTR